MLSFFIVIMAASEAATAHVAKERGVAVRVTYDGHVHKGVARVV